MPILGVYVVVVVFVLCKCSVFTVYFQMYFSIPGIKIIIPLVRITKSSKHCDTFLFSWYGIASPSLVSVQM